MWLYRLLFAFDALMLLVLLYFFVDGLQYGGTSQAAGMWLVMLGVPAALMSGAWHLKARGKRRVATALLFILALPALLYIAFFGLLLLLNPSWQ